MGLTRKARVAQLVAEWEAGLLCAERGFHRNHSSHGTDVEIHEQCLDCGFDRAQERRFVPHIDALDDANHQPSVICCTGGNAHVARNETALIAAMTREAHSQAIYAYYDKCRAEHRDSGD